jgi:hypothetical protein
MGQQSFQLIQRMLAPRPTLLQHAVLAKHPNPTPLIDAYSPLSTLPKPFVIALGWAQTRLSPIGGKRGRDDRRGANGEKETHAARF